MNEPSPSVFRFSHEAMATIFEIFISGDDAAYAEQAAREAFREIDRLERLFSRFDPGSEISRINRLAAGGEIPIGIDTFECLSLAERARRETGGAFDINARASMPTGPTGYPETPPTIDSTGPPRISPGFELIRESGTFAVHRIVADPSESNRLDLDLGAVGKGYALDRALEILQNWGVSDALLHGGTSTALASGSPALSVVSNKPLIANHEPHEGSGWPVGVGAGWPGAPSRIVLSGRALSGSGTEVKGGHILDPRTGRPARGHLAAWASAPTAALSDVLSTAFFVMTADDVEAFVGRNPDLWACLVVSYGDVRVFNSELFPPELS